MIPEPPAASRLGEFGCSHCAGRWEVRVGTDVQEVAPVLASLTAPHAAAYVSRVYRDGEVADCGLGDRPVEVAAASLAARFAAKEAVMKVLRPGDLGVPWTDIEVVRSADGWVEPRLHGVAAAAATAAGLASWALSISHDAAYATASVVALGEHADAPRVRRIVPPPPHE